MGEPDNNGSLWVRRWILDGAHFDSSGRRSLQLGSEEDKNQQSRFELQGRQASLLQVECGTKLYLRKRKDGEGCRRSRPVAIGTTHDDCGIRSTTVKWCLVEGRMMAVVNRVPLTLDAECQSAIWTLILNCTRSKPFTRARLGSSARENIPATVHWKGESDCWCCLGDAWSFTGLELRTSGSCSASSSSASSSSTSSLHLLLASVALLSCILLARLNRQGGNLALRERCPLEQCLGGSTHSKEDNPRSRR